jgi:DNA-binding NtrC family response regulator
MSDVVVITTDDLEPAVRLRGGFDAAGLGVELLTGGETLSDAAGEPVLVILTGAVRGRRATQLMEEARNRGRVPVIGLLEPGQVLSRESCRTLGLAECFVKPIDVDEVVLVGRRTIERERLRSITGIVGETEVMEEVLERVVQIAGVESTVLIQGESGTGKELVARGLHALSRRRHKPFIAVNVAALPDTLLESELFGHEKGAFTGAASLRKGLFELAQSGTIFLDEIGEMGLATQTKLLRVLEEREFRRVGGEELLRADVRVIAATNRELREQVEIGQFRRDLYHRLNVLRITLPPLRERREDISRLIDQFVREFSAQHDRPFPGIERDALEILVDYAWPGNVRELRNLIESMVVLSHGQPIRREDIPVEVRGGGRRGSFLPVLARADSRPDERNVATTSAGSVPEMEFILRSIFDLKIDVDDLRRELDDFRFRRRRELEVPFVSEFASLPSRSVGTVEPEIEEPIAREPEGVVVFRPGMTMQDLEREAISAALRQVRGNRRRAAEMLGIGERTLYRKIKEYDLES